MTEKHPYKFMEIPVGKICVDERYQRGEQPVVKEMVENFDYHRVNAVKVVFRDGDYYAFDGQQTTIGLRTLFGPEYMAPCMIYYDVPSWVDEAKLFEQTNDRKAKSPVKRSDLWKSRSARDDPATMDIISIVNGAGLHVGTGHSKDFKAIRAVDALDYIYANYSRFVLEETVDILAQSFNGSADSLRSPMLRGMAMFISKYHGDYNRKQLVERLNKEGVMSIIRAGKASVAPGSTKYAREILAVYNRGRRNPLPDRF